MRRSDTCVWFPPRRDERNDRRDMQTLLRSAYHGNAILHSASTIPSAWLCGWAAKKTAPIAATSPDETFSRCLTPSFPSPLRRAKHHPLSSEDVWQGEGAPRGQEIWKGSSEPETRSLLFDMTRRGKGFVDVPQASEQSLAYSQAREAHSAVGKKKQKQKQKTKNPCLKMSFSLPRRRHMLDE